MYTSESRKVINSNESRIEEIMSVINHMMEEEDWTVSVPDHGNDRLADLAKSINRMITGARTKIHGLENNITSLSSMNIRMSLINSAVAGIREADDKMRRGGDINALYMDIIKNFMEVTGVDYGAISILDKEGRVKDFITQGISDKEKISMGEMPSGKGLLGAFYHEGKAVRVDNISSDPRSCGFPSGHPIMKSLLGFPLNVSGVTKGVIYLANDAQGRSFSEDDEIIMNMLASEVVDILERNELLDALRDSNHALTKDIVDRKEAQQNLAKTSARLQHLIDNSSTIICSSVPSGDFRITFVSENLIRVFGYEPREMLEDHDFWFNHIHPDDITHIFSSLSRIFVDGQQMHEYRFRHKNGDYLWVHDTLRLIRDKKNNPLEIVSSMVDIDERKKMEEVLRSEKEQQQSLIKQLQEAQSQLLQSEKMASIGQLAAGVAHEINNPVGYVSSNLGSLNNYVGDLFRVIDAYAKIEVLLPGNAKEVQDIQTIKNETDLEFLKVDIAELIKESLGGVKRVKDIVQDLKDFSHVDEAEWQSVDLHKGLDSTLNIAHNEIKYKAKVIKEYGDLPLVECLASQLNQVFMNLLVNAAHAIEDRGIIIMRTGEQDDWVWVEVSDTGKGIPPENIKRIFEPFFTTKPVGKGTGLGLSLSYGIVNKHGGRIEVQSEAGKGTSFKVWLPVRHANIHDERGDKVS